jgi:hypothetical protein
LSALSTRSCTSGTRILRRREPAGKRRSYCASEPNRVALKHHTDVARMAQDPEGDCLQRPGVFPSSISPSSAIRDRQCTAAWLSCRSRLAPECKTALGSFKAHSGNRLITLLGFESLLKSSHTQHNESSTNYNSHESISRLSLNSNPKPA